MGLEVSLSSRLKNFALDIRIQSTARRIGILGPSGSGKSMTLKMIAGIIRPEKGLVEIDGKRLFDSVNKTDIRPQKRKVGYLFQNYALFPSMTVEKNIKAGIDRSVSEKEKKQIASALIGRLGLQGLEGNYPSQLSGGQQQRVALARILANAPDVILLDEPFSALDVHLRDRMMRELMDTLEDFPGIVIMVSHSRDEIYRFSDEIIVIDQGRVIDQGEKKQLFAAPSCVRSAALTGCKNFSRAEKRGDHELFVSDWDLCLKTDRNVPDGLAFIGYRAHDFLPRWGDTEGSKDGCIPFRTERADELPFEINYYLNPTGLHDHPYRTCLWILQRSDMSVVREKGLPGRLQIQDKDILFFER